jgi:hypothetical protein
MRSRPHLAWIAGLLGLVGAMATRVAAAPRVERPVLNVVGACPGAEMVGRAIESLIPGQVLSSADGPARIDLLDQGDSYRVTVTAGGAARERVYRDLAHDCEQRARFAGVFIVLTLMPPEVLVEAAKPAVPASSAAPAASFATDGRSAGAAVAGPAGEVAAVGPPPALNRPEPAPAVRAGAPTSPRAESPATEQPQAGGAFAPLVRIDLGALSELSPAVSSAPSALGWGGAVRCGVGGRRAAGVIGVAWLPRADFTIAGVSGREDRLPIDVSVRLGPGRGRSEVAGELGVVGELLFIEGLNTVHPGHETRFGLGGRAGGTWRLGAGRLAPVIGLHAIWYPKPFDLETTPAGALGKTASLWLGATIGGSLFAAGR